MVTFNYPEFLSAAPAVLLAFLVFALLIQRVQYQNINRFGDRRILALFSRFTANPVRSIAIATALGLLAVSAAEPVMQSGDDASTPTLNAVIVIDVSRSMLALDGPDGMSRLDAGIIAAEQLFTAYPDGQFGLVVYTRIVAAYQPTSDHAALLYILRNIRDNYPAPVRGEGSDLRLALEETADILAGLPYRVGTVFLLSDGGVSQNSSTGPSLPSVLNRLNGMGIRIVATGIGGVIPVTIPVYNENGEIAGTHMVGKDVAYTALNEIPLRNITASTSGIYIDLEETGSLVEAVRAHGLDNQPVAREASVNLTWLPAALALVLAAWAMLRKPS